MKLTIDRLREVLEYDPATGVFLWRAATSKSVRVGTVAGGSHASGYVCIRIDGVLYYSHRLAWLYMTGAWPTAEIDHRNCDRADNRFRNLRDLSHALNCQNSRRARPHSKSGVLGVDRRRASGKFRAAIVVDAKQVHIGHFQTAEEAGAAYVGAKRELHPAGTL